MLAVVLVFIPTQQVNAENINLSDTENVEDEELFSEPILKEDNSDSSETDEDTTEKNDDLDISENENKSEDISESDDKEKSETDVQDGIEAEQSNEENLEESVAIQSIEPETSSEPERPDDLHIGGYIESELDYNTPVCSSTNDTYSDIPSSFPDDMDTLMSTYPGARNQNPYGTCWAFSSMGLAEFDLINDSLNGNGEFDSNIDLSELQLAYFTYNSVVDPLGGTEGDSAKYYNEKATESYLNYGGNYEMASRRLAQWYGPVDESLVPYEKAADTIDNGLDDSYAFGQDEAHLENAYLINIKENADDVKQQIMEHGAAGIMYYHNDNAFSWNETLRKYAYYDTDKSGGGHAVMIVGWDDDFSKDNFTGSSKPSKDGAWLVRNSWGYYASYFWMSYESASLADTAWVFDFLAEDGYDNNYQLDGGVQSYPDKEHKILANVFKTKQEEGTTAEILSAVSLSFTEAANVQYTVDIYTDLQDKTNPYSGTKQENATTIGETAYAGIYTIPLEDSVTLKPGTLFAVVVSVNSAVLDYEQATSIATGEGLTTMIWDCQVSKDNNKSFYFSGGKFYPFYWGNYCVKAFTTDSDIEEPEKPQEKLEGLQEKDGALYYFKNGEIDTTYIGVATYQGEIYYCENGKVAYDYTGLVNGNNKWLYIRNGKQVVEYTGIVQKDKERNIWWYVKDGVYDPSYTGVVEFDSVLFYVENGILDWSYSGVGKSGEIWWNVYGSVAGELYSGLVEEGETWLYIKDGKEATEYTGIVQKDKERNIWWYVKDGVYDPSYTGLVEFDSVLFYVENGILNWSYTGNVIYNGRQYYIMNGSVFYVNCEIDKCSITPVGENELKVTLSMQQNANIEEMYDLYYIVLLDSAGQNVISSVPIREFSLENNKLILSSIFESSDSFAMEATGRYALATKAADQYELRSNSLFISNPEAMARQDGDFKDKYWGYYEGYKVYSKKGIQGADKAYTADLGVQHVLLNVDIQDLVSAGPQSGYIPYTYKGTTFYFSDLIALKKDIYDLHGWGSDDGNNYGENISRNVTLVLLMSWKHDELSYLIHPAARIKGAAPYYSLNMQDEYARNTFEALFCYMGDELGRMKTRVNNWTLGNELNSCNAWNYAGSMSLNDYVANYAQAFQVLHQAVKKTAESPRLFISLDHCWNTADAGFSGKAFLDVFASYMYQTAPDMEWNVNYHSYSQPLSNNTFWNDWWNTTDDTSTRYISMRNIAVLTNYLSYIEQVYGKKSGSIRVIIGELGYSATKGGAESQQAAALGYGYYIAMANKRIDSYIIRAYVDDPTEAAAGLYLGLNADWGYHVKKEAYEVYKYLDRNQSFDYMNRYLSTIGIGSWESAISGFNASEITAGERMFQ